MCFPERRDGSSLDTKHRMSEQITERLFEENPASALTLQADFRVETSTATPRGKQKNTPLCSQKSPHMLGAIFPAGMAVLQQQPLIKLALLTPAFTAQLICSVWLNKQGNTSPRGCQTARTLYICWPGSRRAAC